jgi:hypothetical protein
LDLGGFLEYAYLMLKDPEAQPKLSAFLNHFGIRLFRIHNDDDAPGLDITPKPIIEKFLLDTPISMLISGAPDLVDWWDAGAG